MRRTAWFVSACVVVTFLGSSCSDDADGGHTQGDGFVADVPDLLGVPDTLDQFDTVDPMDVPNDLTDDGEETDQPVLDSAVSDVGFPADGNSGADGNDRDIHVEPDTAVPDVTVGDVNDSSDESFLLSTTLSGVYNDVALDVAWLPTNRPVAVGYSTTNVVGKRVGLVWKHATTEPQQLDSVWAIELAGSTEVSAVLATGTGDLFLFGSTIGSTGSQAWTANMGADGVLNWQKRLENGAWGTMGAALLENGHLAFVGNSGGDEAQCVVVTMDPQGEVVWGSLAGGDAMDSCEAILAVSGGFVTTGWSNSVHRGPWCGAQPCRDGWVVRWDLAGNVVWQRRIFAAGSLTLSHATQTTNGDLWLVGNIVRDGAFYPDVVVLQLDSVGNLTVGKVFEWSHSDVAEAVLAIGEGVIVLGRAGYADAGGLLWALRLDGQGNLVWQKAIGKGFGDAALAVTPNGMEGKFAVAGWTTSFFDAKGTDAWIFGVDLEFKLPETCVGPNFFETTGKPIDWELTAEPVMLTVESFTPTFVATQAKPYPSSIPITDHCKLGEK